MREHEWSSLFRAYGHCVKALYSYCDKMQDLYGEPKTLYRGLVGSWEQTEEEYKVAWICLDSTTTTASCSRLLFVSKYQGMLKNSWSVLKSSFSLKSKGKVVEATRRSANASYGHPSQVCRKVATLQLPLPAASTMTEVEDPFSLKSPLSAEELRCSLGPSTQTRMRSFCSLSKVFESWVSSFPVACWSFSCKLCFWKKVKIVSQSYSTIIIVEHGLSRKSRCVS